MKTNVYVIHDSTVKNPPCSGLSGTTWISNEATHLNENF